ncbi:hypothetical protein ACFU8I_38110, partial [Streptomyces sp. NPDC057540]
MRDPWAGEPEPTDAVRADGPRPSPRPPCGTPLTDPWPASPPGPTDSSWAPGAVVLPGAGPSRADAGAGPAAAVAG